MLSTAEYHPFPIALAGYIVMSAVVATTSSKLLLNNFYDKTLVEYTIVFLVSLFLKILCLISTRQNLKPVFLQVCIQSSPKQKQL